jgi:hypothetical protein
MTNPKHKIPLRDRFVWWMCNRIINTFSSEYYRAFLWLTYDLGRTELQKIMVGWVNEEQEKANTNEKANA